jgi:hypothetical protein
MRIRAHDRVVLDEPAQRSLQGIEPGQAAAHGMAPRVDDELTGKHQLNEPQAHEFAMHFVDEWRLSLEAVRLRPHKIAACQHFDVRLRERREIFRVARGALRRPSNFRARA